MAAVDADRRWTDAANELAAVRPPSRARRTVATAVLVVWVALVLVLLLAVFVRLFGMTGVAGRSGWQVIGAVGVVLLAALGVLRGVRMFAASTLRQVASTGTERRAVRRQMAGREPAAAGRRPVLAAIALEDRDTSLLLIGAIGTYLLGYLDGVAGSGWSSQAALGLPLLVTVFALAAVLPIVRLIGALRHLRAHPPTRDSRAD